MEKNCESFLRFRRYNIKPTLESMWKPPVGPKFEIYGGLARLTKYRCCPMEYMHDRSDVNCHEEYDWIASLDSLDYAYTVFACMHERSFWARDWAREKLLGSE